MKWRGENGELALTGKKDDNNTDGIVRITTPKDIGKTSLFGWGYFKQRKILLTEAKDWKMMSPILVIGCLSLDIHQMIQTIAISIR